MLCVLKGCDIFPSKTHQTLGLYTLLLWPLDYGAVVTTWPNASTDHNIPLTKVVGT